MGQTAHMIGVGLATIAVILVIGLVVSWVWMGVWWSFGPKVTYNRAAHGHLENAYWSNTPELMIENLEKHKAGLQGLGLTADMYGTLYPWKMTPDNRMDYQYKHIDSIISRAEDVKKWRDGQNSQGTQATDVYEQKMDNLREFMQEGGSWSDDIAYDAFEANKHPLFFWMTSWPVVFSELFVVVVTAITGLSMASANRDD